MKVERLNPLDVDAATAQRLADVGNAAIAVDSPHLEPVSGQHLRVRLKYGWDGHGTTDLLLALTDAGDVIGVAELDLPRWDNRHMAAVDVQTHPSHRGQGAGDALFQEARSLVAEAGRTLLMGDAWEGSHRADFWLRHGFSIGSRAAQRRLVMASLDVPRLDSLHAESLEASAAYEVVELPNPAPEDMMAGLLDLQRAMNDAPLDDLALEDDMWSDERFRGYEEAMTRRGIRLVRLLARRRSDGVLGGHTVVAVEDERPWLGFQEDTAVVRGHRGHRLGLRLKVEMLRLLADRDPQIRQIDTWNAESNAHMIAVNDALGTTVVGRGIEFQRDLG